MNAGSSRFYGDGLTVGRHRPRPENRNENRHTHVGFLSSDITTDRRYARVFRNIVMLFNVVVEKIREEAALWSLAGAKNLSSILPRE
jgi:hypothetical protein